MQHLPILCEGIHAQNGASPAQIQGCEQGGLGRGNDEQVPQLNFLVSGPPPLRNSLYIGAVFHGAPNHEPIKWQKQHDPPPENAVFIFFDCHYFVDLINIMKQLVSGVNYRKLAQKIRD